MVCSSVIFIPSIMIYEFIKAWKVTSNDQYQVETVFFVLIIFKLLFFIQIDESTPHYLRMLTYARQPDNEWGPTKNENRFGRYKPKIDKSIYACQSDVGGDDDSNLNSDSEDIFRVRL